MFIVIPKTYVGVNLIDSMSGLLTFQGLFVETEGYENEKEEPYKGEDEEENACLVDPIPRTYV